MAYRAKNDPEHAISDFREVVRLAPGNDGPAKQALESLAAGEPKADTGEPKRGVLDLLK